MKSKVKGRKEERGDADFGGHEASSFYSMKRPRLKIIIRSIYTPP